MLILWIDEIHFATPKKPWNDDSPVSTKNNGFPWLQSGAGFRPATVLPHIVIDSL